MTYKPTPQKTRGGQPEAWTADEEVRDLLREICGLLRTLTAHMATITDEQIGETDAD